MSPDQRQPPTAALTALAGGAIEIVGRLPWSSNFTFLVDVINDSISTRAVYKPLQGEQDLWDFPAKIYKREVAAYILSVALGWPNIPPTIIRDDAPFGTGSLQLFVPSNFEQHFFTLFNTGNHDVDLRRIATFDIIANNADRKAGHCLLGEDGSIYAIDNGLCFHEDPKLRTVIWEYEGEPIPEPPIEDIRRVINDLPQQLHQLLTPSETNALLMRMNQLLTKPVFPNLTSQRQFPWPLI